MRKIHYALACAITSLPLGYSASAQLPLGGVQVEELAIPASIKSNIAIDLATDSSLVHCYRVYICLLEPLWELQAIFGGNGYGDWTLNGTSTFYQHPFGSETGDGINSGLFPIFPELQYDSWFTINADVSADPQVIFSFDGPPQTFSVWETTGGNYTSSTPYGTAISNVVGYPNTSGMPDVFGRILIAQLTSAGSFSGIINLQFRRLNANGSIFLPVTLSNALNIPFDSDMITGPCAFLLPIHILRFEGSSEGDINILSFELDHSQTASWKMLHSEDTMNWEYIGEGETLLNQVVNHFTHEHVRSGLHYYKLIARGEDEEEVESDIVTIVTQSKTQIYPNPFSDQLYLTSSSYSNSEVDIYSSTGTVISHFTTAHPLENIDTSQWPSGLYFILVKSDEQSPQVFKVVRE